MKNTLRKLPGIGIRIISFIPALNWISLLYIGLINSSILNVICAVAYAVIAFTDASLFPLIWIVGIVHYAGAYQNVKKQIIGDTGDSTLPGIGIRIISFIPGLNWTSLLYIGLINPRQYIGLINFSILNIMCAVAYGVITFTDTSLSPLIWMVGIVHYAIAYQYIKMQIIGDTGKSTTQRLTTSVNNNTSVANEFSDVVVSGEQENKQQIPVRLSYASEDVRVSVSQKQEDKQQIPVKPSYASEDVRVSVSQKQEDKQQIPIRPSYASEDVRVSVSPKSTSVANVFSDVVISGEQENKQSIPIRPSYASEDVRVSVSQKQEDKQQIPVKPSYASEDVRVSVSQKQEDKQSIPVRPSYASEDVKVSFSIHNIYAKFFTDMEINASREGKTAAFVSFMSYWPTYDSMNKAQQAWYFYWRSQIRQGNYIDTDLSYIFVLIYELLSGVGWQDPYEGYQKLIQLWTAYRKKFPSLDRYLTGWTFDFTQQYNLEYKLSEVDEYPRLAPSIMTDILIARHEKDVPLKLHFSLINALSDYSLVKSKFYKDGNQDLMNEAIPRMISLADAALRKNRQQGILDTYGPPHIHEQEYYTFASAVCPQANKKICVTVKNYSTYPKLRAYISELVRYGENTLRELQGYQGRLRGVTIDKETAKLVENFLENEYRQQVTQENKPSKEPQFILDVEKIKKLRGDSDAVRTALEVKETAIPEKKALLTDIQEVTAIYTDISPNARSLLDRLEKSSWECSAAQGDEPLMAEINLLAERYLGCALLVAEASKIITEDDYRDELEYIYQNQPATSSEGKISKLFDSSVLTPEMKEFVDALLPAQQKALYVLITNENPQSYLEAIAEEALTMPQPLLDDINTQALKHMGYIIVDAADQKPQILDEYIDLLKQSVAQGEKTKCRL